MRHFPLGPAEAEFFTDFLSDFDTESANYWTLANIASGTAALTTLDTAVSGAVGVAQLTGGASDNYGGSMVWTSKPTFLTAGKEFSVVARVQMADMTESQFKFGLVDATSTADDTDLADFIGFHKPDDATTLNLVYSSTAAGDVVAQSAAATLSNSTWYTLGLNVRITSTGVGEVRWYLDGKPLKTATYTNLPLATLAMFPIYLAMQNGTGAQKYLLVDYVGWKETR